MISAAEAQQLLQQGRVTEAEHAFELILQKEPNNVPALNFMALAALRKDDIPSALEQIESALKADSANPLTLHNRGRILEAAQRYDEAAASQRKALQSAPNLHIARLHLGRALELSHKTDEAIVAYSRALQDAQQNGRWLNQATTPPAFQALIQHAVLQVRLGRRAAVEALLRPLTDEFGRDSLRRVQAGIRIYFNEDTQQTADPRQSPTFFHMPGVPASPYVSLELFPWIERLEASTTKIRGELYGLLEQSKGRERVFTSEELEAAHLRGMHQPPSWNGYYFYRHGEPRLENHARCPETVAALHATSLCRIRGHGPEVLFSVFTPGTHLLPHRGVTNARLVAHLPLLVPEDCALVVGGEEHRWHEGKVVVFDDTYEHEAWNRSDKIRIVLIFDVWSPFLSEAERAALTALFGNIGDFRQAVDTAA